MVMMLAACAGAPLKYAGVNEGHWKAKALIKDLDQSRSYIVNLNLNARREGYARMDVTSALNTGVASLVASPKDVRYLLFASKRFYYGTPTADVMRPILALPFDPRWLLNLLFETPIKEKGWTCVTSGDWLDSCREPGLGLKVTWSARRGAGRTIFIEHSKATVQLNVLSFEPKVEDRKNLFDLEAPAGWTKLRVR